ncbi:MAG: hypothetical protein VKL98_04940 [Cyanobacteriota bacterium]|nr:hypothetical protein [Cyanobacteriota bacterium]
MFTGIDLIVLLVVLGIIFYATQSDSGEGGGGAKVKVNVEPLTVLVIVMVAAMVVGSLL